MSDELQMLSDEEVFSLEAEVTAEAVKRRTLSQFREQARTMAEQAKELGSSQTAVGDLIQSVLEEVYAPEPAPE